MIREDQGWNINIVKISGSSGTYKKKPQQRGNRNIKRWCIKGRESFRKEDGQQSQTLQREGMKGSHWISIATGFSDHSKNIMSEATMAEVILQGDEFHILEDEQFHTMPQCVNWSEGLKWIWEIDHQSRGG